MAKQKQEKCCSIAGEMEKCMDDMRKRHGQMPGMRKGVEMEMEDDEDEMPMKKGKK